MAWLDTAIEQAGEAITVDVSDMGLGVDSIQIKPLSAKEYQALKAHPEIASIRDADDKTERIGLMMVCEMMSKCDESISWTKLQQLPLQTLATLSNKITTAIGTTQGGGVLGE